LYCLIKDNNLYQQTAHMSYGWSESDSF
jgi:hypothetical protein